MEDIYLCLILNAYEGEMTGAQEPGARPSFADELVSFYVPVRSHGDMRANYF